MARNRKRRSERRPGQAADAAARPGVATANAAHRDEAPDPIEHASPDAELAEAQLAAGRARLDDDGDPGEPVDDAALEEAALGRGNGRSDAPVPDRAAAASGVPTARGGNRLVQFLVGSWHELQRVQWPDRRQVMQATGVVIGFVIVAGVFLGVADFVAQKLVTLILQ